MPRGSPGVARFRVTLAIAIDSPGLRCSTSSIFGGSPRFFASCSRHAVLAVAARGAGPPYPGARPPSGFPMRPHPRPARRDGGPHPGLARNTRAASLRGSGKASYCVRLRVSHGGSEGWFATNDHRTSVVLPSPRKWGRLHNGKPGGCGCHPERRRYAARSPPPRASIDHRRAGVSRDTWF